MRNRMGSFVLMSVLVSSAALAEETTMEKGKALTNEASDSVKKTYRDVKDKGCEMVNGKMECLAKKVGNKARNLKDSVGTEAEKVKDKVD